MAHTLIALRTWLVASLPERDDERGASLVEYALLVVLIAVVCAVAITALGNELNSSYSSTASGLG